MSTYYKYNFISPEPLYNNVKEELRSYFDTGVVDDLMFPIWTQKCLSKLGRGAYKITEGYLEVKNYEAKLPAGFIAVREAWMCTTLYKQAPIPGAYYKQSTFRVGGQPIDPCAVPPCKECEDCPPDVINITYKTTNEVIVSFKTSYLLKPGNISVRSNCTLDCRNFGSSAMETFDIRDNKFVTNFTEGDVYIIYYSHETTEEGDPLIPDNFRIKEYIEAYLKYKIFEHLYNTVTDETFNQVERKYMNYKQIYDESYILANIEKKKDTVHDKMRKIKTSYNRLNPYNLD